LEPACKLTALPFGELEKFVTISSEIGQCPKTLYYITAYRITKEHVRARLTVAQSTSSENSFTLFERALVRNQLINHSELKSKLGSLADRFQKRYGSCFQLD